MVFSLEKNNKSMLFHYSFRITSVVFIVSITDADPTSVFLTPLTSVSEQNCQELVCIFLECKEHFGNKIILIC